MILLESEKAISQKFTKNRFKYQGCKMLIFKPALIYKYKKLTLSYYKQQ